MLLAKKQTMLAPTRCILALALALTATALVATPAVAQTAPQIAPGEFLVQWRDGAAIPRLERVAGYPVLSARPITEQLWVYQLAQQTTGATWRAVEQLTDDPAVELVEPNYIRHRFRVPNDPHYALQWNLKAVKIEQAWDRTTGGQGNVVAVVDTGILPDHPDLTGRLLQGYDFIADPANAGDGNGWDPDPRDNGTSNLSSSAFHGTHVAGIIGATSNNQKGMTGVDWGCRVLPVRALGIQQGKGRDADIVAAIKWAAGVQVKNAPANKTPARVINLSFGGPGASAILSSAIKEAISRGVVVVAAAGNQNTDAQNIYPAAVQGAVTVGASQFDHKRAPYSNYGPVVDVMAPGGDMAQTLPFKYQNKDWKAGVLGTLYITSTKKFGYHLFEGTSQAAPLVAGVAALILSVRPTLKPADVLAVLKSSADPKGKCAAGCGTGLVNAATALAAAATWNPSGKTPTGTDLPFAASCTKDDQCKDRVCRDVPGSGRICTRFCSDDGNCPSGGTCAGEMCKPGPGTSTYSPGNPSTGQPGPRPGTVVGIGACTLAGPGASPPHAGGSLALALLLGVALVARRARR